MPACLSSPTYWCLVGSAILAVGAEFTQQTLSVTTHGDFSSSAGTVERRCRHTPILSCVVVNTKLGFS